MSGRLLSRMYDTKRSPFLQKSLEIRGMPHKRPLQLTGFSAILAIAGRIGAAQ